MAKVISYKLTSNGGVPHYVADGGYLGTLEKWQDITLVGISKDSDITYDNEGNATEVPIVLPDDVTVYETKAELIAYLDTYTTGWTNQANIEDEPTPFSSATAADEIWAKLPA